MLSPSTPQHLSSPFLLQKNRDKREESQPEKAFKSKSNFKCFPLLGKNFWGVLCQVWSRIYGLVCNVKVSGAVDAPGCRCDFVPVGTVGQSPSPAGFVGALARQGGIPPGLYSCLGGSYCKSHSPAVLVC